MEVTMNETEISLMCDADYCNLYSSLSPYDRSKKTIGEMISLYENKFELQLNKS